MDNQQPQTPNRGRPQSQAQGGQTPPYQYIKLPDFMLENQNAATPEPETQSWIQSDTKKIMIIGGILGIGMLLVGLALVLVLNSSRNAQRSGVVADLREQIIIDPIEDDLQTEDFKNMMAVWDGSLDATAHKAAYSKALTAIKNTRSRFKNIQTAAQSYAEALGVADADAAAQVVEDGIAGMVDQKYAILAPVLYYVYTLDDTLTDMELFVTIGNRYYNAGYTVVDTGQLKQLTAADVAESRVESVFDKSDEMSSEYASEYVALRYEYLTEIAECYEDYGNYLAGLSTMTADVRTGVEDCNTLFRESVQEIQSFEESAEFQDALNTWKFYEFEDNGLEEVQKALGA